MATTNKNFKVKNGLDVSGPIGVGSSPNYGLSGQALVSNGSGSAPTWTSISGTGGGGISNVVEDTTPQLGGDLDAQSFDITAVNAITLDTTPTSVPATVGTISWDVDNETVNILLNGANLQVGQEHLIRVKNNSGSVAIPDRTPVMFAGATGDTVKVSPAVSSNVAVYPSDYMVGITTEEIPADGFGFVTQFGFINNVNTTDWTVGTLLYVDPATAGGLTSTKPSAPAWQTPIAAVTKQNGSAGRILVRAIPGIALGSVEGVTIDSPADNEVLAWNSGTSTWVNQTAAEAGLATSTHNHDGVYQPVGSYLTSETDPIFTASAAYGITSTDISHWTSAYNWGNHATAGYLTSLTGTLDGYAKYNIADIQQKTANYTLVLTDANDMIEVSSASGVTITVPTNANVAYPTKTEIHILQTGAGQITVAGDTGVTVNGTPGLKFRDQWSMATLIKRDTNTWVLVGDLTA